MNKIYITTGFTGHWPVGCSAVVIAESPEEACDQLNTELRNNHNLIGDCRPEYMEQIVKPGVYVLQDGEY